MEQLPVPKNVLDVEFKLFGSLTVKQFLKVLLGCLIALGLFLVPGLHPIIKIPGIGIALVVGVGSALLPSFQVKLLALLRAVFVSPRYVWRKETQVPEVLKSKLSSQENTGDASAVAASRDPDDITIDQVLSVRSAVMDSAAVAATNPAYGSAAAHAQQEDNFSEIYREVYGLQSLDDSLAGRNQTPEQVVRMNNNLAGNAGAGVKVPVGKNMQVNVQPVSNSAPRAATSVLQPSQMAAENTNQQNLLQNYQLELGMLKSQLQELNKKGGEEKNREQIQKRINEIYAAIKSSSQQQTDKVVQPQQSAPSKLIYGVVVDKKDKPVQGVSVEIDTLEGKTLIHDVQTRMDGSFAIDAPLTAGEYVIKLHHPSLKFYDFKIVIDKGILPGYKFRAK
ncbi:hypothetical protein KC640_03060 [Candidatus Dojkabacteria bacterium]|uniref:Carboxypeptidase regulatory-like domain-containing protein n=1 Tax=Candidatus Dojkabacteria bacterium TaxID=2099670 RepID=A0A955KZT0_9BACT|nr:hypothetical protein [Candidatus Dojkabacteria bacterium]